jgi:P4 family phage/plasmid primase-like protien
VTTGSDRFKKAVNWYSSNDWQILPCHGIVEGRCTCGQKHEESKDIGKHPAINAWNRESTSDIEKLNSWWESNPEYNVGINCKTSGFFVIDIDPRSGGEDSFEKFESYVEGALPPTAEATTGKYEINGKIIYGRHIYYKCDINEDLIGNLSKLGFKGIDIKHNGYVLVSPSRHFSGVTYEWVKGKEPWNTPIAEAPEDLLKALRKRQRYTAGGNSYESADWDSVKGMGLDIDKILEEGLVEGERAVMLHKLACALANKFGTKTEAQRLAVETLMIRFNAEKVVPPMPLEGQNGLLMHTRRAIEFVTKNPLIDKIWPGAAEYANNMIEDTRRTQEGKEEIQTLLGVVQPINDSTDYTLPGSIGGNVSKNIESGMSLDEASSNEAMGAIKDQDAVREEDRGPDYKHRSFTDTGNGRRIIDSFGPALRYTPGLGWFTWSNGFWKPDMEDLNIQELSKKLGSLVASEIKHYDESEADKRQQIIQWAAQAKSEARLKSAINNANSDPRIRVDVDKWDQDPNMLGVTNGVVDLRTGKLIKGNPELYITKRAPVAYTRGLTNMRWQQFLDFATDGDKEFQEWIQRAAGYSLTGLSRYDILFLVYGPAGSGKNTLVEAIVKCLGSSQYAFPLDSSILALDGGSSRSTDLYHWAEMRGRRMVWVDELPDNERIKENSVKKLTGSSEISARSPGEKPFTFQSQAKLWITTNHRPIITDDAMWRRIRPIPMIKTPEKADPGLKEYIFDPDGALPAVLSWAVEGAIKVLGSSQKDGLGWCKAVSEAAEMYRKNEDRIALFLEEELVTAVGATITVKQVFQLYRTWSEDRGERPMTQIAFDRKLRERNLKIEGSGAKATIFDRYMSPRQVPLGSSADWGLLSATARNL